MDVAPSALRPPAGGLTSNVDSRGRAQDRLRRDWLAVPRLLDHMTGATDWYFDVAAQVDLK